jgi:NSS family neurotransmitter:Na+ symporter
MQRERLGSRLGFIFMSASCAIGLGNVWKFPYLAGAYGGGLFFLIFIICLVLVALPILAVEFSVGRASQRSIARSFHELQPKGTKWHIMGYFGLAGNYLLMMFYTTVSGWMINYFIRMVRGDFVGADNAQVGNAFASMLASPSQNVLWMAVYTVLGFLVCAMGLRKSVEKITKLMMSGLFVILLILVINGLTLPGAADGLKFLFVPRFDVLQEQSIFRIIFEALGQAFFTISVGMGSMAIFGSFIDKQRRLLGESINVGILDMIVSIFSGIVVFTAVFTYNMPDDARAGPGLIFLTLPNVFVHMPFGRFWGSMFFLFINFAAFTTVIAIFENIVGCFMDMTGWSRKKSALVNIPILIVASLPVALGFNVLSGIQPLGPGTNFLDLFDFILSNNILPIGAVVYVLFCMSKRGWGYDNFIKEINAGKGVKFPTNARFYFTYIVPVAVLFVFVMGYVTKFFG